MNEVSSDASLILWIRYEWSFLQSASVTFTMLPPVASAEIMLHLTDIDSLNFSLEPAFNDN